jgi:serine/threonine protein kinase/Tfp pilus assembly protein PilF
MIGKTISHYKILEKIGGGGMGVVYKAEDLKLKRTVALKFLPHEFTDDVIAKKRFIQEAQSASSLDHPNICTIHEIGETDEHQLFIAMACYEGETLKHKIEKGPVEIKEAIMIALGISLGLAKAHSQGIIHRDMKPANVFITSDKQVKILDFGLAKLAGTTRITKTESITGTVAYMSPEMIRSEEVDHRTDIWSLGAVLYEMLTGHLPFKGENWEATMYAICNIAPISIRQLRKDTPPSLERMIMKMLQKKPQDRYDSIQNAAADLQSIDLLAKERSTLTALKPSASIVVLPFIDMSPASDQEYFCDGIAEEIINSLTQILDLRVVARTSAFSFKGKHIDVREIGRALNVDHVLEGSVRKAGNQLRITAQLVNVTDGYHLWSERFDREEEDIFAVQDEISLMIVNKLKVRIMGDERKSLQKRRTSNIEAYNSYLKGHFFSGKHTEADIHKAIKYYEQATMQDPNYADAYAAMSENYCLLSLNYYAPSKQVFPRAKIAAETALEKDRRLAIAHSAMGLIHYVFDWDIERAWQRLERAIEFEPNNPSIILHLAGYHLQIGELDEAIKAGERALEIDPFSIVYNTHLGLYYLRARQLKEARQQLLKTLDFAPKQVAALWLLAITYALDLEYDTCIRLLNDALCVNKDYTPVIASLGWVYAMSGDKKSARKILKELEERAKKSYIAPFLFAKIHAALDQKDLAFQWLDRAYDERDTALIHVLTDESVDSIRDDPRFDELLKKIGLYKYKKQKRSS